MFSNFRIKGISFLIAAGLFFHGASVCNGAEKVKIFAHQGVPQLVQGNTLTSIALAASGDSDYITMDIALTSDNKPVVYGDIELERHTNVRELYPERNREDGKYYVIDFSYDEVRNLTLIPMEDEGLHHLHIPLLSDVLTVLRRVEKERGIEIGIAPEIKKPWFYLHEGHDISSAVIETLNTFNYTAKNSSAYLQYHDPEELQRVKKELLTPKFYNIKLIHIFDTTNENETMRFEQGKWQPYKIDWLFTRSGPRLLANYASAVSISKDNILSSLNDENFTSFLDATEGYGMDIFIHSLSDRPREIPIEFDEYPDMLAQLCNSVKVSGFITEAVVSTEKFLQKAGACYPLVEQPLEHNKAILPLLPKKE